MRKIKRYGCKPDLIDHRDLMFVRSEHFDKLIEIPRSVNLVDKLPACWDQGDLGSCTGHGSGAAMAFLKPGFMPSRLMIYFDGRQIEGDTDDDAGAQIRDVVSGLANQGVCDEGLWPYDISQFAVEPTPACYDLAKDNLISQYFRCSDLDDIKNSLAQGFPVIIGFSVYSNFEAPEMATDGILHMPSAQDEMLGGHCVLVIGYDDDRGQVFVRNSWGTGWGLNGNFWMDYAYFQNLVNDCWTLRA